jgi:hypothetical protein
MEWKIDKMEAKIVGHYMFLAWIMLRPQGEEGHGDLAMSQYC